MRDDRIPLGTDDIPTQEEHFEDTEDWEGIADYDPTIAPQDWEDGHPDNKDSWCVLCGKSDDGFGHDCEADEDYDPDWD